MDTKDIKELIEALNQSAYSYIDIKHEGTQIILSKEAVGVSTPAVQSASAAQKVDAVKAVSVETVTKSVVSVNDSDCFVVKSPIVGTFYAASSPEVGPYVSKGDVVKKGQTLCIIEAMKLMNEVEADVDGEIVEIIAGNESVVEYGQPLFKIKTK